MNVNYSDWLCVDPNPSGARPDLGSLVSRVSSNTSSAPIETELGSSAQDPGMNEVDAAYRLYLDGKYQEALQAFETIVATYPENFAGRRALVFVERTLEKLGRSGEILTRLNAASATYTGRLLGKFAEARRTYEYIKRGLYQDAIAQASEAVQQNVDTTFVKFALYDLGSIYWYSLGDTKNGAQYYNQLIARFPNDPLSHSAQATLGWSIGQQKPAATTSSLGTGFQLDNYPNPFNPSTVIRYQLPVHSYVTLKVYDLLGQEVATLVDENRPAGYHETMWDASRLASGVYFYRMLAGEYTAVKKLILMK